MSDSHDYLLTGENAKFQLTANVMMLMLRGAAYAAVVCLGTWFLIWAMYAIGLLLPEESRETPDPTPLSFNITISDTDYV